MTQHDHEPIPSELEGIHDALESLARADRDAAPRDLASRVAHAASESEPPSVLARIGPSGALRIAAALALGALGVLGATLLTSNTGPGAPPAEIDIQAIASEGAQTLQLAYASNDIVSDGDADSIWGLGGERTSDGTLDGASLWDLGSDAFENDIDWSGLEEVL